MEREEGRGEGRRKRRELKGKKTIDIRKHPRVFQEYLKIFKVFL